MKTKVILRATSLVALVLSVVPAANAGYVMWSSDPANPVDVQRYVTFGQSGVFDFVAGVQQGPYAGPGNLGTSTIFGVWANPNGGFDVEAGTAWHVVSQWTTLGAQLVWNDRSLTVTNALKMDNMDFGVVLAHLDGSSLPVSSLTNLPTLYTGPYTQNSVFVSAAYGANSIYGVGPVPLDDVRRGAEMYFSGPSRAYPWQALSLFGPAMGDVPLPLEGQGILGASGAPGFYLDADGHPQWAFTLFSNSPGVTASMMVGQSEFADFLDNADQGFQTTSAVPEPPGLVLAAIALSAAALFREKLGLAA